jgi:hypothetical protein
MGIVPNTFSKFVDAVEQQYPEIASLPADLKSSPGKWLAHLMQQNQGDLWRMSYFLKNLWTGEIYGGGWQEFNRFEDKSGGQDTIKDIKEALPKFGDSYNTAYIDASIPEPNSPWVSGTIAAMPASQVTYLVAHPAYQYPPERYAGQSVPYGFPYRPPTGVPIATEQLKQEPYVSTFFVNDFPGDDKAPHFALFLNQTSEDIIESWNHIADENYKPTKKPGQPISVPRQALIRIDRKI